MSAVDTSVAIAAMSSWHPQHEQARDAAGRRPSLPAHCGIELYSVLTRLPDPFRVAPATAAEVITVAYLERWLMPEPSTVHGLPAELARLDIVGGAIYDALVAVTVRDHGVSLITLDGRAESVYRALGVDYELLG